MNFNQAIKNTSQYTRTENGMKSLKTSNSGLVDLFFKMGAARRWTNEDVEALIAGAFADTEKTSDVIKTLFYARDIRGGMGERRLFRKALVFMSKNANYHLTLKRVLPLVPEYGRWDDLLVLINDRKFGFQVVNMIKKALLKDQNALCAKWMPRRGEAYKTLRARLQWTPAFYRKTISELSKTVEQQMCANEWGDIEYSHIPSVASSRYQKAFHRHDGERYSDYIDALTNKDHEDHGKVKVNADVVFPHDVMMSALKGDSRMAQAQWDALPNLLGDSAIMPMVDTSGSMTCPCTGSASAMLVAISLGLYVSQKQTGAFQGAFLNFASDSKIHYFQKDAYLADMYAIASRTEWQMTTNFESALDSILEVAKQNNLPASSMPKYIIVFSDMQFDEGVRNADESAFEMAQRSFAEAGYEVPNFVWWNLSSRKGDVTVKFTEKGNALVSGFSPSILKTILQAGSDGSDFTPINVVMKAISNERYDAVEKAVNRPVPRKPAKARGKQNAEQALKRAQRPPQRRTPRK